MGSPVKGATTAMPHLDDPPNPRHAHMFEILRQTQQASNTINRINVAATKQLDDHVAQKIIENAVQSLRFA